MEALPSPPDGNKDENVRVVMNARIDNPGLNKLISSYADKVALGLISQLPDDLDDVFSVQLYERPSGSRYVVVDFSD